MTDFLPIKQFDFIAGDLCLDFTNTMGGKRGLATREHLNRYVDFVGWCQQAGLVNKAQAQTLVVKAAQEPAGAASVLGRALELREAIFRMAVALGANRSPARGDVVRLNGEVAGASGRLQVVLGPGKSGLTWRWIAADAGLDHPLGPVARAAADLLTSGKVGRIEQCQGDTCGWLFIDASKNHSRRWCDMRDCGNRAKVRRHRLKQQG
jgi:predicted RNA-binding Zn ribbon-like protein